MNESGAAPFPVLSPDLQIRFWTHLQLFRNEYLSESLSGVVANADIRRLDGELQDLVGNQLLSVLARYALRGEAFFPVPYILAAKPMLLGYYRLLYGLSQKEFYAKGPFGRFKLMEEANRLSADATKLLEELCRSLISTGAQLLAGIEPVSIATVHDLQLLTVGPQLRGSENNVIGKGATAVVFELVRSIVSSHVVSSTPRIITIRNAAGRTVQIAFASDPDIAILEALPSAAVPTVSIEIKGGTDRSNVHNRIGEAEKSHQKAKAAGFTQFWTILNARIDLDAAQRESPTTTRFFQLDELLDRSSAQYGHFRDLVFQVVGIG